MTIVPTADLYQCIGPFSPSVLIKGDYVGHPFRGNQWTDASGATRVGAVSSLGAARQRFGRTAQEVSDHFEHKHGIKIDVQSEDDGSINPVNEAAFYGSVQALDDLLNAGFALPSSIKDFTILGYATAADGSVQPYGDGTASVSFSPPALTVTAERIADGELPQGYSVTADFATRGAPSLEVLKQRLGYAVMVHEFAHMLDVNSGRTPVRSPNDWRSQSLDPRSLSSSDADRIKSEIAATSASEYGSLNRQEYVAELFTAWVLGDASAKSALQPWLDSLPNLPVLKGDYVGHPFRGTQWVDASGVSRGRSSTAPTATRLSKRIAPWEQRMVNPNGPVSVLGHVLEKQVFRDAWHQAGQLIRDPRVLEILERFGERSGPYPALRESVDAWTSLKVANPNMFEIDDGSAVGLSTDEMKVRTSLIVSQILKAGVVAQLSADMEEQGVTNELAAEAIGFIETQTVADYSGLLGTSQRDVALLAHIIVQRWAVSSNDEDALSLAIQEIAARGGGLGEGVAVQANPSSSPESFVPASALQRPSRASPEMTADLQARTQRIANDPTTGMVIAAALQSQYDRTQEYLAARGIISVELYRGLSHKPLAEARRAALDADPVVGKASRAFQEADKNLKDLLRQASDWRQTSVRLNELNAAEAVRDKLEAELFSAERNVAVRLRAGMRPLTSFSTDAQTALEFANGVQMGVASGSALLLRASVAARQIYSTPLTGSGCLSEQEAVVSANSLLIEYTNLANYRTVYPTDTGGSGKARIVRAEDQ